MLYVGFWQKSQKFLARNFCTEVYRFGVTKTATPYYIIYTIILPAYITSSCWNHFDTRKNNIILMSINVHTFR